MCVHAFARYAVICGKKTGGYFCICACLCAHVKRGVCLGVCTELCHIVYTKKVAFANAETAPQGEAIAVCLLLVGTFSEN